MHAHRGIFFQVHFRVIQREVLLQLVTGLQRKLDQHRNSTFWKRVGQRHLVAKQCTSRSRKTPRNATFIPKKMMLHRRSGPSQNNIHWQLLTQAVKYPTWSRRIRLIPHTNVVWSSLRINTHLKGTSKLCNHTLWLTSFAQKKHFQKFVNYFIYESS